MTVIPTSKPATVITTDEPTTVKDTATRARLRADFYRYILSSHYDHKLTATEGIALIKLVTTFLSPDANPYCAKCLDSRYCC